MKGAEKTKGRKNSFFFFLEFGACRNLERVLCMGWFAGVNFKSRVALVGRPFWQWNLGEPTAVHCHNARTAQTYIVL